MRYPLVLKHTEGRLDIHSHRHVASGKGLFNKDELGVHQLYAVVQQGIEGTVLQLM